MKYLYGAAVQGIQDFIFQTNKLKEIVGASDLVEEICTSVFAALLGKHVDLNNDKSAIVHAAGNIKYVFDDEDACKKMVRCFPMKVSQIAPGVTVSQSVVKYENDKDFPKAVKDLEKNLRIQRNKPVRYPMLGLMGVERSRNTGLPVCKIVGDKHLDAATYAKRCSVGNTVGKLCVKAFGEESVKAKKLPYEISDLTGSNDWIAVIHADGNGLGQIVQKIGTDADQFKNFSQLLDKATVQAAVNAYNQVSSGIDSKVIPMRPIVLGGDDLTVICRADLAVSYVKCFINEFQIQTQKELENILKANKVFAGNINYLTACAGIAYVKSSFPFYYGYSLAESLCSYAKTDAKAELNEGELPASCIMFHKVQDSFVDTYKEIVDRELKPQENITLSFGPYYLDKNKERWTIDELLVKTGTLDTIEGNAIKSGLRNWLSLLHTNVELADQFMDRLKEVSGAKSFLEVVSDKGVIRNGMIAYPVYDMLALHAVNTQQTK